MYQSERISVCVFVYSASVPEIGFATYSYYLRNRNSNIMEIFLTSTSIKNDAAVPRSF